jgi:hypothetical protein
MKPLTGSASGWRSRALLSEQVEQLRERVDSLALELSRLQQQCQRLVQLSASDQFYDRQMGALLRWYSQREARQPVPEQIQLKLRRFQSLLSPAWDRRQGLSSSPPS